MCAGDTALPRSITCKGTSYADVHCDLFPCTCCELSDHKTLAEAGIRNGDDLYMDHGTSWSMFCCFISPFLVLLLAVVLFNCTAWLLNMILEFSSINDRA